MSSIYSDNEIPTITSTILKYMKLYLEHFVSEFKLEEHFLDINEKINYLAYDKKFLNTIFEKGWEKCNFQLEFRCDRFKFEYKNVIKSQTKEIIYEYILDKKERIERTYKKPSKIITHIKPILKTSKKPKVSFNSHDQIKIITRERE